MEPVFKNVNFSGNVAKFQLSPTHVAYANTLRRLCMSYVESVGFRADIGNDGSTTDVKIISNSTPMTNEMLAHRIGLLPIYADPKGWDPEKYLFVLNKINDTEKVMDIYASDFKVLEKRGDETVENNSRDFFRPSLTGSNVNRQISGANDTCLIATLKPLLPGGKPEEIHIEAKATVGIGRQHARFIPTTQCAYSYTLDTNPEHIKETFNTWVTNTKMFSDPSLLDKDEYKQKKAEFMREFNTLQINRCYLKDESGEPYSFDFTMESVGPLDCKKIVLEACEKAIEICKRFVADNLPKDVIIQRTDTQLLGYDIVFQRQDHTLGHLLQAWIDQNLVGKGAITFAGYDIPHPLRDEMVLRVGVSDGDEKSARFALKSAAAACEAMFQTWRDQWSGMTQGVVEPTKDVEVIGTRRIVRRPTTVKK
jgi:DNA-directed RNA polymerase subunit D